MARTTSTQRGASRRTPTSTAKRGSGGRAASTRSRASSPRTRSTSPRTATARRTGVARPSGPWVPIVVVAIVVVLGWTMYPALKLEYQASRRMAGLEQERDTLKQRNAALRAQVAALKTPEGVEKAAREGLGYTKKGENAYIVMPSTSSSAAAGATRTASAASGGSIIQTVLDAIFGVSKPSTSVEP